MIIDPHNLPNDLSILAIKILCFLAENARGNVTTVAGSFSPDVTKASMVSASVHLFNLEQAGLVERFRSNNDRRVSRFALTQKGQRLVHAWQPKYALVS